jgi:hypothetical protein
MANYYAQQPNPSNYVPPPINQPNYPQQINPASYVPSMPVYNNHQQTAPSYANHNPPQQSYTQNYQFNDNKAYSGGGWPQSPTMNAP